MGFTWEDTFETFREVRVELGTGGTPGETHDNNLFRLMVTAIDDLGEIPPEEITAWGKTLRPDGSVYKKLPDNTYVDSTPVVNEPCYTYTLDLQKVKLLIKRGTQDITHQTTTVWVGERVELQCVFAFSIAALGLETIDSYSWTIPGNKIKGWDANASQSTLTPFPASDLQNPSVVFYWVDGHNEAVVQCTVQVGGETVTTQAKFIVKRPIATLGASILNNVAVDTLWNYTPLQPALHFGNVVVPGIRFSYNTDSEGYYQYVQTGSAMRAYNHGVENRWYVASGSGLDTYYPYPKEKVNNVETQRAGDAPGTGPLTQLEYMCEDNFEMHLMFMANVPHQGGVPGAIWVPLRKRWWNWYGYAGLVSGEYALLEDGGGPEVGGDCNSTEYPSWNSNINDGIDEPTDYIPQ